MWHANVFALIDQSAAHTLRYLTMTNANVDAPVYSDVLVDRDSIQIHVSVNAQSQDLHVQIIRNLTMWHANVSVRISQSAAHTLKYLTMTNADVDVPLYSDALVGNGLIHVHVDVSVLNQELSVPMFRTLMM
jgi:molybdenum cofactor biosynthesis enzyme MoaA